MENRGVFEKIPWASYKSTFQQWDISWPVLYHISIMDGASYTCRLASCSSLVALDFFISVAGSIVDKALENF